MGSVYTHMHRHGHRHTHIHAKKHTHTHYGSWKENGRHQVAMIVIGGKAERAEWGIVMHVHVCVHACISLCLIRVACVHGWEVICWSMVS